MRHSRGFTLIETIVYIGLFALLIGGSIITTYQILRASERAGVKSTVQDEESFVLRKIDWALGSIDPTKSYTPSSGTATTLSLTQYGSTNVIIVRLNGSKVEMSEDGGTTYYPLTTSNVDVTGLTFTYIAPSGNGPAGISATLTIKNDTDSQTFTSVSTKYIRK
jgi:type II secretory pathway pseudopilin PulG